MEVDLEQSETEAESYCNLPDGERDLYKKKLLRIQGGQWVGVREDGGEFWVCQMCLTEHSGPNRPNPEASICEDCYRDWVAPVTPFEPEERPCRHYGHLYPSARFAIPIDCKECFDAIPHGERIRTYCCKNFLCLQCYCEAAEVSCPICPVCERPLMISVWAIELYFLKTCRKPGFAQIYGQISPQEISKLLCESKEMALKHVDFCWEAWVVKQFYWFAHHLVWSGGYKFKSFFDSK